MLLLNYSKNTKMDRIKTIIVIGAGPILPTALIEQIKHSNGMDLEVISDEQAREKGIIPKDALQMEQKPFIFKDIPRLEMPTVFYDKHQAKNDCKKGWRKNKY